MTAAKTSLQKFLMLVLAVQTASFAAGRPAIAQTQATTGNSSSASTTASTTASTSNTSSASTSNSSNAASATSSDANPNPYESTITSKTYAPPPPPPAPSANQYNPSGTVGAPTVPPSSAGTITINDDDAQFPEKTKKKRVQKETYIRSYNKPEQTKPGTAAAGMLPTPDTNPTASAPLPTLTRGGLAVPPAPAGTEEAAAQSRVALPATNAAAAARDANLPSTTPPVSAAIQPLLIQANTELAANKIESAIKILSAAVRQDPSCVTARRSLSYALLKNSQPLEALQQVEYIGKLMKLTPFDDCAMGESFFVLGDYEQAYDAYKNAVDVNPNLDNARMGAIKALTSMNRWDEAIKLCAAGAYNSKDKKMHDYYSQLYTETVARRIASHGATR